MITFSQFTTDFPEFGNGVATQGQFNLYANLASILLPQDRWGAPGPDLNGNATQYDFGSELFIAHNISLGVLAQKQAAGGGAPGQNSGAVASRGAGPLSVSYDTTAGLEPDAGHWNLTFYGTRFIQMLRLIGAAPTVSSPAGCGNALNGPAWVGPWPYPGYFG
jgi:hypothetical protein